MSLLHRGIDSHQLDVLANTGNIAARPSRKLINVVIIIPAKAWQVTAWQQHEVSGTAFSNLVFLGRSRASACEPTVVDGRYIAPTELREVRKGSGSQPEIVLQQSSKQGRRPQTYQLVPKARDIHALRNSNCSAKVYSRPTAPQVCGRLPSLFCVKFCRTATRLAMGPSVDLLLQPRRC